MPDPFVPADFEVPVGLRAPEFRLEPLGPQHNHPDFAAWSSSIAHIHATPGWEQSSWPSEMTLDENRDDLERHADDFANRVGFTYTVLDPEDADVIGCVYIYPARDESHDVRVLSWVRASRAELDAALWQAVSDWLDREWPFKRVEYAARGVRRPRAGP